MSIGEVRKIMDLEQEINKIVKDTLDQELDWSDYFEAVETIIGNTEKVQQLREMVNDFYGLNIISKGE